MRRVPKRKGGQSLVEFALVVPIFLLLLFGMVEFGRAWMTKNIITGAAREAVRIYARIPYDNVLARTRAENVMTSAGLDLGRVVGGVRLIETAINLTETEMRVEISYNFPVIIFGIIPGLPSNNILLATSTTMRKE